MKTLLILILLPFAVSAQSVDVKDVSASDESTTIEIRKGKAAETKNSEWEVAEGTADIEGEAGATTKDARAKWDKACKEWKDEFRSDNKENKIISMNCGKSECSGDAGNKICVSTANYKIKTKVN